MSVEIERYIKVISRSLPEGIEVNDVRQAILATSSGGVKEQYDSRVLDLVADYILFYANVYQENPDKKILSRRQIARRKQRELLLEDWQLYEENNSLTHSGINTDVVCDFDVFSLVVSCSGGGGVDQGKFGQHQKVLREYYKHYLLIRECSRYSVTLRFIFIILNKVLIESGLSDRQSLFFKFYYVGGYSQKLIAKMYNTTSSAVYSCIHEAVVKICKTVAENYPMLLELKMIEEVFHGEESK